MKRAWAAVGLAFVAALIAGVLHLRSIREREMAASDDALSKNDLPAAIDHAKLAAEASGDEGYARLEQIARDATSRGDEATAGRAWRAMRTAATSTAGSRARRDQANVALAQQAAREVARAQPATPAAARDEEARVLDELSREDTPATSSFLLLALGAAIFYGGVGWWLRRRGREPDARVL